MHDHPQGGRSRDAAVAQRGGCVSLSSSYLPSRWLIWALTVATFVNFLGSLAFAPFLPQIADDLGVTVALVGQIPAVVTLLAGLLGLVIGPLADHYGLGRALKGGVLAAIVSTLAIGLAPSVLFLFIVSVFGAVARAAVQPSAQATVSAQIQ